MAEHPLWNDDYWILVMQLYMRKPMGMKAMYARATVNLCLELHIPPEIIYEKMYALRRHDAPSLRRLWEKYSQDGRRLSRDARMVRRMCGFGTANAFFDGVQTSSPFEQLFMPIVGNEALKPVMLVIVLDLYFRLMPATMVADTPEVRQTARLMRIDANQVVQMLTLFRRLDPFLNGSGEAPTADTALMKACANIWQRYGNGNPQELSATAALMRYYFRSPSSPRRRTARRK